MEGGRVMAETILRMYGIQKYFPGVHALDNAQLEVREGEVMALIGENGAGKSTLMKILTGVYTKDAGTIELFGKQVEIRDPHDAQSKGISIVHQELNLMQDLTVAENIFIGREPTKGLFVDKAEQNRMADELLQSLHLNIQAKTQVKRLTVAKQQMVEIAKALSYNNTKVLIMDEPSAALTESEIEDLFTFIRRLKATGVGIVYISHRMDELKQITDRITVMRDGQYVDTVDTATTTIDQVVQMMVGRVIYEEPKTKSSVPADAPVVLEAEHLVSDDVKDVSFQLRKGEILGFAGLMGAGRTETARLVCGADKRTGGTIKVNGKEVHIHSPRDAVEAGIGYLSEDRKRYGLCLGLSVADNTAMASLDKLSGPIFVNDRKITAAAVEHAEKVRTKTPTVRTLVRSLSGGNQQKVVIARSLSTNPKVVILDEPTRGIDAAARSDVYSIIRQLKDAGVAVLMVSSDIEEVVELADRAITVFQGRINGEFKREEITQDVLTSASFGIGRERTV